MEDPEDPEGPEGPGLDATRVLGRVEGPSSDGPVLVVLAGLHGNEPAGVLALRRVLPELAARREHVRGRLVALAGNVGALRAGVRHVDRDLNRAWGAAEEAGGAEDAERAELAAALADAAAPCRSPVYFLDLHTTSGEGGPFTTIADTLPARSFALHLPVPLILGLEELVDGTLLGHLGERGWIGVAFEAGQHDEPRAVDRAEAAVWLAVAAAGLLPEGRVREATGARELLLGDTVHLPRVLEMRYRHGVAPEDAFRMRPGWRNFRPVRRGEPLGDDRSGPVTAPESGRVLMPLYQSQGSDGFFLVREFRPFWLHVSAALRRARADRFVHWLPGIRRHPDISGGLVVDRRVARWYALELLHLLGYRRHLDRGATLVVVRRRFDGREGGGDAGTRSPDVTAPGRSG